MSIATAMTLGMVTGFFLGVAVSGSTRRRGFTGENTRGPSGPPPFKLRRSTSNPTARKP